MIYSSKPLWKQNRKSKCAKRKWGKNQEKQQSEFQEEEHQSGFASVAAAANWLLTVLPSDV